MLLSRSIYRSLLTDIDLGDANVCQKRPIYRSLLTVNVCQKRPIYRSLLKDIDLGDANKGGVVSEDSAISVTVMQRK